MTDFYLMNLMIKFFWQVVKEYWQKIASQSCHPIAKANGFVRPWPHMVPGAHKSQPLKRHLDRFGRSCIHHRLRSKDLQCFSMAQTTPKNCPFPLGISTPKIHMVPWAHPTQPPNSISISSGRFRKAHERDQQTDTDWPRYSVCSKHQ